MNIALRKPPLDRALEVCRALASATRRGLARTGRALWRALEVQGRARARRELRMAAERYAITQPDLARTLRAASRDDTGSV
jgi:hypothetical protein